MRVDTEHDRSVYYADNLRQGFDALAELYYTYWGEAFHLALFEPGETEDDFDRALARTHERYFTALRAGSAARVLDLCCGGGAFSAWLAARSPAEVVGVDLSAKQIGHGRERAKRDGLANLRFIRHDAMRITEIIEAPFDAAVCLDAACYLPDRQAALEGVARVLRPGGRVLFVDWCLGGRPTRLQRELILEPFYRAWAIPTLETVDGYRRAFDRAGFRLIELVDLSEWVGPNWERGYRVALAALAEPVRPLQLLSLVARFGPQAVRVAKEQFNVALLAKAAADSGLLRYTYLLGERLPA